LIINTLIDRNGRIDIQDQRVEFNNNKFRIRIGIGIGDIAHTKGDIGTAPKRTPAYGSTGNHKRWRHSPARAADN